MKEILFVTLLMIVVLIAGCTQSSLYNIVENQTTTKPTNSLDPTVLVSSKPEDIILKQEEMISNWTIRNTWGDYLYDARYANNNTDYCSSVAEIPHCSELSTMGISDSYNSIGASVYKYNNINDASEKYNKILNETRSNKRTVKQDVVEVGNERFGAIGYDSLGCSGYKVVFRRNNIVVSIRLSRYLEDCPTDSQMLEVQNYAVLMDMRIS